MDANFTHYLIVLLAIVVAVILIKKVTSCLFRIITTVVLVGILAYIYFAYFR